MSERLYSCKEIAAALQISVRIVQLRASSDDQSWQPAATTKVRGQAQRLYDYKDLPLDIRKAIDQHEARTAAESTWERLQEAMEAERDRQLADELVAAIECDDQAKAQKAKERQRVVREGRALFAKLPKDSPRRIRAEARNWARLASNAWRQKHRLGWRDAWFDFAAKVNAGEIPLPERVRAGLPRLKDGTHLTEGSLREWNAKYNARGIWGLVDNYQGKRGKAKIENTPALEAAILGAVQKKPHINGLKIKTWIRAEKPDLDIVSAAGIDRYIRRARAQQPQLWTFITNPDKWKNIHMAAPGSAHERIERLNQVWELDSTPGDWMLTDGRHSVIGCIDLYSRRVKLYVSKTSTTTAVKQLTRRCLLDWGVPEAVRTDNGSDYISESYNALLRDLEIRHEICLPFASEQKGTIERFFRTMSHGLPELLDGFIGHNVAERKVIEARKSFAARVMDRESVVEVSMTSSDLQAKLDAWVEHVYHQDAHSGLDHRAPREVARDWAHPVAMLESEHILDDLLSESAGTRQILKKGVRIDGRWYVDRTYEMWAHVGESVVVRYDEHDLGQVGLYLMRDGMLEFLSWAYNEDTLGIDRAEYAAAAKRRQRRFLSEAKASLRAATAEVMRDFHRNPMDAIIEMRKAEAENVVDLPKRTVPYRTPATDEAKRAHAARAPRESMPLVDEQLQVEQPAEAEVIAFSDDPRRVYVRYLKICERMAEGERITDADQSFYTLYHDSDSCESMRSLADYDPETFRYLANE